MATLRSALETRVQKIVVDNDTDVVARVVPELKKAQRDLEEIAYNFLIQEEEVAGSPDVAAAASLVEAVPTDWLEPRGVSNRLVGGTGEDQNDLVTMPTLTWLEWDEELFREQTAAAANLTAQGPPKWITIIGTDIHVFPYADVAYTLRIPYWKRLLKLDNVGDSNWWTDNAEDYLVFRASARTLLFNRDHEESLRYEAFAQAERKSLVRTDKRARFRKANNRLRLRRDVNAKITQQRM